MWGCPSLSGGSHNKDYSLEYNRVEIGVPHL